MRRATAGLREATLSWSAPFDDDPATTGYVITPYLDGEAQTPVTVDAATTTRVVNGLTPGGSYTFTVAAVSSQGTSDASPASDPVVPYAELGAPTITSVRIGDTSAVLTWDPPSSTGGSPVTGYVVTPYIGSVAQRPRKRSPHGDHPHRHRAHPRAPRTRSAWPRRTPPAPAPSTASTPADRSSPPPTTVRTGPLTPPTTALTATTAVASGRTALLRPRWTRRSRRVHPRPCSTENVSATCPGTSRSPPAPGSDPSCHSAVPVLGLNVFLAAAPAEVVAGGALGYTITPTNTGGGDYAAATVSDDLRALLPYGVYAQDATASSGQVSDSGGTLTWSGPLARGEQARITFSVRIGVDIPDEAVLTNRVVSTSTGSTCPADSADPGCSTSTTIAARTLTLSDLTPSFTLTGLPGSTVEQDGAVGMTVSTNSPGGYSVTVAASADALTGSTPGNADTIPIDQVSVRESGTRLFTPLSRNPVLVHTSTGPSSPGGDAISNDYRVDVPDVASDAYSTTLEYVATAQ